MTILEHIQDMRQRKLNRAQATTKKVFSTVDENNHDTQHIKSVLIFSCADI